MPAARPPWPSAEPDPHERLKLAVAVTGLVFVTLLGWVLVSYLSSLLDFLSSLWGLLALLALLASGVAFAAALLFTYGRRRPPVAADAATLDGVQTRQM
ncbi:MAG TPA: hypothetical protein VGB42_11690 [Candidatus Thermoplasmatota archaeon]